MSRLDILMGVIYKLRDEVVEFIITQRQGNPLYSCRQLAESASEKFGLHLSKSSVHDVLKESGIVTPRGRKPKEKFEIPQEKKKQIQNSLSQIKLLSPPAGPEIKLITETIEPGKRLNDINKETMVLSSKGLATMPEYEGAGRIFIKAALWDLGIFSEQKIKEMDWKYYLTYSRGVKVLLENNKDFFIELSMPIERCIREVADGLISNTRPFFLESVSDQSLFNACMDAQEGFKMTEVCIVDSKNNILFKTDSIVESKRNFIVNKMTNVVSYEKLPAERAATAFFSQTDGINDVISYLENIRGFDIIEQDKITVNLLIEMSYGNKNKILEGAERLNGMFLRDDADRLVHVNILTSEG